MKFNIFTQDKRAADRIDKLFKDNLIGPINFRKGDTLNFDYTVEVPDADVQLTRLLAFVKMHKKGMLKLTLDDLKTFRRQCRKLQDDMETILIELEPL